MTANNLRSSPIERRRLATLSGESCEDCRKQLHQDRDTLPHPRLMIVSATPVVESFGGGVETRYICLDCGYTITHSTRPVRPGLALRAGSAQAAWPVAAPRGLARSRAAS